MLNNIFTFGSSKHGIDCNRQFDRSKTSRQKSAFDETKQNLKKKRSFSCVKSKHWALRSSTVLVDNDYFGCLHSSMEVAQDKSYLYCNSQFYLVFILTGPAIASSHLKWIGKSYPWTQSAQLPGQCFLFLACVSLPISFPIIVSAIFFLRLRSQWNHCFQTSRHRRFT